MSLCTCKSCGCYFANLETAACPACYKAAVSYAVSATDALREALAFVTGDLRLNCADGESDRDCYNRCRAAWLVKARDALAKNPNPAGTVAALVAERESTPEGKDAMDRARARLAQRLETGPNTARPVPCAERDEMCWRRSCRAQDTCVEREMRERDSRHQSGTQPPEGLREDPPTAFLVGVLEGLAGQFKGDGREKLAERLRIAAGRLADYSQRHQVGRNDELKTAATALYKWLLAVPHMDPPMARFSIPDEIWEPFQDALFDGAKP